MKPTFGDGKLCNPREISKRLAEEMDKDVSESKAWMVKCFPSVDWESEDGRRLATIMFPIYMNNKEMK